MGAREVVRTTMWVECAIRTLGSWEEITPFPSRQRLRLPAVFRQVGVVWCDGKGCVHVCVYGWGVR